MTINANIWRLARLVHPVHLSWVLKIKDPNMVKKINQA